MKKKIALWILALVATLVVVAYQRITGPTYPRKETLSLQGQEYSIKLLRSHGGDQDCPLKLAIDNPKVTGTLYYHRYRVDEPYKAVEFKREGKGLMAYMPHQPPAGKLQYSIELTDGKETKSLYKNHPVVIRFKRAVPLFILLPHILCMFAAMFLSTLAFLYAVGKVEGSRFYAFLTFGFFLVGGMILGPIVQKYAFGIFWSGVPFDWDLTDNKTLIAFLGWLTAVIANYKKERPVYTIVAAVLLLAVYLIPHSMFGSEFDYSKGKLGTGS